jgi:hypothetical protein
MDFSTRTVLSSDIPFQKMMISGSGKPDGLIS